MFFATRIRELYQNDMKSPVRTKQSLQKTQSDWLSTEKAYRLEHE